MKNYWESFWAACGETLLTIYKLKTNGNELLLPAARAHMVSCAVLITMQFGVDLWAWTRVWSYALPDLDWTPRFLGLASATVIAVFDRSVVVVDTSKSRWQLWPLAWRLAALMVLALLTSVPVELSTFQSEIENRIAHEEMEAINEIRKRALTEEGAKFDAESAEAKQRLDAQASDLVGRGQKDIEELEKSRKEGRQLIFDDYTNRANIAALEAAGKGPSGNYGAREAFAVMKQQEVEAAQRLKDFDAKTLELTAQLRADREAKQTESSTKATDDLTVLAKAKDAKLQEIRAMDPDPLAKQYGGQLEKQPDGSEEFVNPKWERDRGIGTRYMELQEMINDPKGGPFINMVVWGARIFMILIGLFILVFKLMAPIEFKHYYSFGAQAAAADDDEDITEVAAAVGYAASKESRRGMGYTPEIRDRIEWVLKAQRRLIEAWSNFQNRVTELARSEGSIGKRINAIHDALFAYWTTNVQSAIFALDEAEELCRLNGIALPAWPTGTDPRANHDPWKVTKEDLAARGWRDPDPAHRAFEEDAAQIVQWREQIEDALIIMDEELSRYLLNHAGVSDTELVTRFLPERRATWRNRILPHLRALRKVEVTARDLGVTLPPWTASVDPETAWQMPTIERLRELGWQPPQRTRVAIVEMPTPAPPPRIETPIPPPPVAEPPPADDPLDRLLADEPTAAPVSTPAPPPPPPAPEPAAPVSVADTATEASWLANGDARGDHDTDPDGMAAPPPPSPPHPLPPARPATEPDIDIEESPAVPLNVPAPPPTEPPPPPEASPPVAEPPAAEPPVAAAPTAPAAPSPSPESDDEAIAALNMTRAAAGIPDNAAERLAAIVIDPGAAAAIRASAELITCPNCNGQVKQAGFCSQCGMKLASPVPPDGNPPTHLAPVPPTPEADPPVANEPAPAAATPKRGAARRTRRGTTAKRKPTD